jgi:hypothetical protein
LATGDDIDWISRELERLEGEREEDTLEAEQDTVTHRILTAMPIVDEVVGPMDKNLLLLVSKGKGKEDVIDGASGDEGEVEIDQLLDEGPASPLSCQVTICMPQNKSAPPPPHPPLKTTFKTQGPKIWAVSLLFEPELNVPDFPVCLLFLYPSLFISDCNLV